MAKPWNQPKNPTWKEYEALEQDLDHAFQRIVALEKAVNALCRASHQHVRLPDWEGNGYVNPGNDCD